MVAVCGLGLVALVILLKECRGTTVGTINAVGTQVSNAIHATGVVLEKFTTGQITHTFEESLPVVTRDGGGRLELASVSATESFTRTDSKITAWGYLDLGDTISEIRVPATYTYYLRLHDTWRLEAPGTNVCVVHAPAIHAGLPPAIDTARMEKKSSRGWARLNAQDQMTELEKSITPTLTAYARDKRHLAVVREDCRKTVAEFVRDWLLREKQWRDDRFTSIKVIFPDEVVTNALDAPATLELKTQ